MAAPDRRTVTLPPEQSSYIDKMVGEGRYASASEVVRAGLHALKERDEVVEHWLRSEVVQAYDMMTADPARAITLDDAFAAVRRRNAKHPVQD